MSPASRRKASRGSTADTRADADSPRAPKPFNVLSFVTGLVSMVGGVSFLGQQNAWFSVDLGTVLPIVAIVGGLAAIFGTRRNE
jgi:hypothetical protein